MTIENSQEEKEQVERNINRINEDSYSRTTKPTHRELDEGRSSILQDQLQNQAPETYEILKKRRLEEEKARKLRDESNVTKVGEKNIISSIEKTIKNEQTHLYLSSEHSVLGSIPSRLDKPRKHMSKKKGWGLFENMSKAAYGKRVRDLMSMSEENRINLALADAEAIDRKNLAILRNKHKTT